MSQIHSPAEEAFFACRDALDHVTESFKALIENTRYPGTYEADMAATQLFSCTWLHVNALSKISEIRYLGSHFVPAQCLCRAAVEAGLTAYWLVEPDDWRLREARWLRWVNREEQHRKKLSRDIAKIHKDTSSALESEQLALEDRRKQIELQLKDHLAVDQLEVELERNPSFESILNDLNIRDNFYIRYRFLSHVLHSGPSGVQNVLRASNSGSIGMYMAHSPQDWSDLLVTAGYSMQAGLPSFAKRVGASSDRIDATIKAFSELVRVGQSLNDVYSFNNQKAI